MSVKTLVSGFVHSDIVVRSAHTFMQSFLAVWIATGFKLDKVALIAALAAGISAVKTVVVSSVKVARS